MKNSIPIGRSLSLLLSAARRTTALLAVVQILGGLALHADPLDTYEVVYPATTNYQGGNVFYGDGQWIELRGEMGPWGDGRIRHSADGIAWSKSQVPLGFVPANAAYANGLWVVVGEEELAGADQFSAVLTSTDGVMWEKRNAYSETWRLLNKTPYLGHVAYGNGLWIAMGWKGQYLTSTDGLHWTSGAISNYQRTQHLTYGNDRWLVISSLISDSSNAHVSTDGLNWTTYDLPMYGFASVTFGGGQWAAIVYGEEENQIVTSTDGIEWVTRQRITHRFWEAMNWQIGYGDGGWLVAGTESFSETGPRNSFTYSSTDGLNWARKTIPTSPLFETFARYTSVRYGNGKWLLKANHYYNDSGFKPYLLSSTDAVNWTAAVEPETGVYSLTYADGKWAMMGDGLDGRGIYTSTNSREWTKISPTWVNALAHSDGRWVGGRAGGGIVTSTDLMNWTLTYTFNGWISGFAFANGLWVGVGSETLNNGNPVPLMVTSPDGLTWTRRTLPPGATGPLLDKPVWGNGRWLMLAGSADGRSMLTSTDGVNWSNVDGLTGSVVGVGPDLHFAEGTWIALAGRLHPDGIRRPTTLRSTDGLQWTTQDVDVELSELRSVIHAGGRWIIGSSVPIGSRHYPALLSSADGQHWTTHLVGQESSLSNHSLASNGKELLAVGWGYIISFGRLIPAAPPQLRLSKEGPDLSLWLSGELGAQYAIEQSAELDAAQWDPLQNVILTTNPQEIPLAAPTGSHGFWRARGP